ncbi:hypothetical protein STEG23_004452, partial [Scotinomys teguina]
SLSVLLLLWTIWPVVPPPLGSCALPHQPQSRRCSTDFPTVQSDRGRSSSEDPSPQESSACDQLAKQMNKQPPSLQQQPTSTDGLLYCL